MVRPDPDNMGSIDSPDARIDGRVLNAGRRVLDNISDVSATARHALYSSMIRPNILQPRIRSPKVSRDARALKYEARNQVNDIPRNDRTGLERRDGYFRAERMAMPEHELAKTRDNIEIIPKRPILIRGVAAKDVDGNNISVDVEIDHQKWFWPSQKSDPEFQRLLRSKSHYRNWIHHGATAPLYFTYDMLTSLLRLRSPAFFARRGITVRGPDFHHFTPEQTEVIADQYTFITDGYQNISRLYSANDTSELNIQTAMAIARKYPDEVLGAVTTSKAKAVKDVEAVRSTIQLAAAITDLGQISKSPQEFSLKGIEDELGFVQSDLSNVGAFGTATIRSAVGTKIKGRTYLNFALPAVQADIIKKLEEYEVKLEAAKSYYNKITSALMRVKSAAKDADKNAAEILKYFKTDGSIDETKIDTDVDPKIIADKLSVEIAIKEKADYLKELADKEKVVDDIEKGVSAPSSREAILRTYQIHFQEQGVSPEEARVQALKLYALNASGNREWKFAEKVLQREDVLGQEGRVRQWPYQQLKELALGSQESFVCHIAESPAIGLQHEISNKFYNPVPFAPKFTRLFDSTRRLGLLWRKTNARPAWGAMSKEQLQIAFYAIRNAVQAKDLSNTRYVRATTREIARLLLDKLSIERTLRLETEPEAEDKKKAEAAPQQKQFHDEIELMLAGDPPPEIAAAVNSAIAHARTETGGIRRWAGREIKNATGFGKKTYTSIPARTTLAVLKSPYTVGKWGLGKITGGVKSLWKKANEETTFFS